MNSAMKGDYAKSGRCLTVGPSGIKVNSKFRENFFPGLTLCAIDDSGNCTVIDDGDVIFSEGMSRFGVEKHPAGKQPIWVKARLLGLL